MKVFFDTSVSTDKNIYKLFKKTAKELNFELVYDWEKRGDIWKGSRVGDDKRIKIYSDTLNLMNFSNVCIFDATLPSMRIGHELTLSMERMKPTLVLMNENLNDAHNLFLRGSNSKFLTFKNYKNEKEFFKNIEDFIKKNKGEKKIRLDVKIDNRLNDFLDELSVLNKTSKVEEIKQVLLEG